MPEDVSPPVSVSAALLAHVLLLPLWLVLLGVSAVLESSPSVSVLALVQARFALPPRAIEAQRRLMIVASPMLPHRSQTQTRVVVIYIGVHFSTWIDALWSLIESKRDLQLLREEPSRL